MNFNKLNLNIDFNKLELRPDYGNGERSYVKLYHKRAEEVNQMLRDEYKKYGFYLFGYKHNNSNYSSSINDHEYSNYYNFDNESEVSDTETDGYISNPEINLDYNSDSSEYSSDNELN